MNILICGAGEVGFHSAQALAHTGHHVTVIDLDPERIRMVEDVMDVATIVGNGARADVLMPAGVANTDLLVAATDHDEVNLLTASLGKGLGAKKTLARVHHRAFFDDMDFDYQRHLQIDRLICPEYSTALAIARGLRNPGALAIEGFARGKIEMQEFRVSPGANAIGKSLSEIKLPEGTRLAAITRKGGAFIPDATTNIEPEDIVILVGDTTVFQEARREFHNEDTGLRRLVIMGGLPMSVWLCRALKDRDFAVRLFETDRARAEAVAEKLDWITVIHADPTDPIVFDDENLSQADAFIALLDDEEQNILGCAWAKSMGMKTAIAVVHRANYMHLLKHVGIDRAFSPRQVAVTEIELVADDSKLRHMATLAEGIIDVYRVRVGSGSAVVGRPLREVKLSPNWVLAAILQDGDIRVPRADDCIHPSDTLLVVGRHDRESTLRRLFATG